VVPGILYVVATPIGNLEDVTLRALRVLRDVSVIAAEDTRRTARLLQHYSISTRTTSLHEHNERSKTPPLVARLMAGESIALVSDAGTPVISDPGAHLVAAAHAAGVRVESVPGPNAAIALLAATGFGGDSFVFAGFPPSRSNARTRWLEALAGETRTLIFYEAPHRIRATLEEMLQIWGDRTVAVGRELTKLHEELVIKPISAQLGDPLEERGEFVIAVKALKNPAPYSQAEVTPADMVAEFGELTHNRGLGRREAIKQLAAKYQLSAREVFSRLESAKNSVD
jgi:16S rRNA (cytidine1402-2'-O)-methyltransferase